MKQRILDMSIILGSLMGIVTAILFFTKGNIDNYVIEHIKEYEQSTDHRVNQILLFEQYIKSPAFEKHLYNHIEGDSSTTLNFRKLIALGLGISERQVVSRVIEILREDANRIEENIKQKIRLANVLTLLNRLYPDENVWRTD